MASIERLNRAVLLAMLGLTLLTQRGAAFFVMSCGFAALYGLAASSRLAHVRESVLGRGVWLVPLIVLLSVYESLGRLIAATGIPLRDSVVLGVEYAVTGAVLPPLADWHLPAAVVDAFSLAYLGYFALPVALLWSVWRRCGVHAASQVLLTLLVAFYVHYAIYVVMPVVGPIRAIDVTGAVRDRLVAEGGTVTHVMRAMVGAVEGTRQDAFPSAHTSLSLLVAALARRYRLRARMGFYAITASIIASTVVLGYHYVTDLIAAVPVAVFVWRGMTHRGDASEFLRGQADPPPCTSTGRPSTVYL
jgi:membrane-associated phospholipid phosphatase